MNYGEIRQNLISLGFAEQSDLDEFDSLGYTYDAINRAISQIGSQFPLIAKYEFELDEDDTGIVYIDMSLQTGFLELAEETPIVYEADGQSLYRKFTDYQVEMGHNIVMKADDYKGKFRVYYNKECTKVTSSTTDNTAIELPVKVHYLIPLLTAYYLWLDDDERKAVMYYNMYETQLGLLLQKENKPRMRVNTDWGEDNRSRWLVKAAGNTPSESENAEDDG